MSCTEKIVRLFVFACNILVWAIGVALLALGLYIFLDGKEYEALMDASLFSVAVVMIVVGFVIALIGFMGCCGAVKKSSCMLLLYALLLLIIIILQIATAALAFVFRATAAEHVRSGLLDSLAGYGGTSTEEKVYTEAVDLAQANFKCCGVDSNQDYGNSSLAMKWASAGNSSNTPDSCCKTQTSGCGTGQSSVTSANSTIYTQGCLVKLEDFLETNMEIVGISAVVFVIIEICNMIFSLILWKKYK